MSQETKIQSIREMAIEVGELHAQQLEAWEATKLQADALGRALYSSSGLEPPVPLEQWDWRGTAILGRLIEACDDILSRMLQPQQGGDAEAYDSIKVVKGFLISASDFKPGMSKLGRLTAFLNDLSCRNGWRKEPEKEATEPNPICGEKMRTTRTVYECQLPEGHDGRHNRTPAKPEFRTGPLSGELDENIAVKFKLENPLPGSTLIRMTIDGNQRATAEASKSFNRMSAELFDVGLAASIGELKSALLDLIKGDGKRVTVLEWGGVPEVDGLFVGRVLSRRNDHIEAFIVSYNMRDGTTDPAEVPEYVRESFRRAIHETLLSSMSKEKFESHEMSPEDVEKRLVAMREHYDFSDEEVVAKATDGTIPPDPDYCEWLVLLGRSDLIRS